MRAPATRLVVDPIACTGHGLCAELFPEQISKDDWGYPIVDAAPLQPHDRVNAQRAIDACPALALRLAARAGVSEGVRPLDGGRRRKSQRGGLKGSDPLS